MCNIVWNLYWGFTGKLITYKDSAENTVLYVTSNKQEEKRGGPKKWSGREQETFFLLGLTLTWNVAGWDNN